MPEPTIAQRIVRAKRTLAEARVAFELPPREELDARLASVLEVIYLDLQRGLLGDRRATTGCAPRCARRRCGSGRILAGLAPDEPEVHGLVALMEIQASRSRARIGPTASRCCCSTRTAPAGTTCSIRRGLAALERAEELGGALGPYALQAAIAACHARARTREETDWERIVALYDGARSSSRRRRSWS